MQAGIRTKDLAFFIIFARFVLPVVLGIGAVVLIYGVDFFPDWSWFKQIRRPSPARWSAATRRPTSG